MSELRQVQIRRASPADAEIVGGMDRNLCRCCGYTRIKAAVRLAATRLREATHAQR